jgi:hypothetical protein
VNIQGRIAEFNPWQKMPGNASKTLSGQGFSKILRSIKPEIQEKFQKIDNTPIKE